MALPPPARIMVDPSLLLARDGVALLEDAAVRRSIVIPATFGRWLREERNLNIESLVAPDDLEAVSVSRMRLIEALDDFAVFSYEQSSMPRHAQAVLAALLESDDPLRELHADEWAYIQSQSIFTSKLRNAIDAFRDAGATIVELGRKAGRQLIESVIPPDHIPPALDLGLIGKVATKWIVVGGAEVGGGTLGGVVGTVVGGPAGALIGHITVGKVAHELAKSAVLAIDP